MKKLLEAGVYEHVFDVMFRPPDKKPKVERFVDDVFRQYSDEEATDCWMTVMKRKLAMMCNGLIAQRAMKIKEMILKKTQHYVSSAG
ncbi:hypothetical protein MTO96_026973 [Rhipicephalus appendiculatus]